jgi:hypothetical protein
MYRGARLVLICFDRSAVTELLDRDDLDTALHVDHVLLDLGHDFLRILIEYHGMRGLLLCKTCFYARRRFD